MCIVDGKATLTGVTSWGVGCGVKGSPGLYADVYKYREWIYEIVSTGTYATPPPPVVIYVDVDFVMNMIRSITGPVYCINQRGSFNEAKTTRLQDRLNVVDIGLKQQISLKVLGKKLCSKNHAGQVTTNDFFIWRDSEKTFPKLVEEIINISKFMAAGCKQKTIDREVDIIERVFQRYQNLLNRMADKNCFGRQEKVVKTVFKF